MFFLFKASQPALIPLLHMDLFGPTSVRSLNHKTYCLVITDDFSRCDNGTEFKNMDFIEFCGSKGIKREYSNARTPQQNGVAERKNMTLIEAARTMLADSFLPNIFLAEANCCGQVLWIQNQMLDYGFNFMNTRIYIDNESTICIVKNPVFHSKTKHIEIRHHFIRDAYEKQLIQVSKIHTDNNVVDLLTKAFDVSRFQFLVVAIRMINQ
ncbi:putative ribonuclease H-like domain-containing protein [Tanacetum coccineum]